MNEKIIETEEIRHMRDNVAKKLRVREKHVQELQDDNVRMADELRSLRVEVSHSVSRCFLLDFGVIQ